MNTIPPPPFKIGQRIVPADIEYWNSNLPDFCEEYRRHLHAQRYELRVSVPLVFLLESAKIFEVAGLSFKGFNLDNPFALSEGLSNGHYDVQLLVRFGAGENEHAVVISMAFPSYLFKVEPQQHACKVCNCLVPEDRDCKCFCSNMCADNAMYDSLCGPICDCD